MKRRAIRRSDLSPPRPNLSNPCRALVPVDGIGIRKKIKTDYEKALRDLDRSRRMFDRFETEDQPRFERWLNSHFGGLLSEVREIRLKLALDEELICQVQNESFFGATSLPRAYQRVMEDRQSPPPPPPGAGGPPPEDREDSFGPGDEFEGAGDQGDPCAFFKELFGGAESDGYSYGKSHSGLGHSTDPDPKPNRAARLKDLYRALVRRLHPDSQVEMTPQKTEWWHQAQAAYQIGDPDELELILTLCEIGDTGTTAHTSASMLQRVTAQLKSSLRSIKRQIREKRRDPAWGFADRSDQEAMGVELRRGLTNELQSMKERWARSRKIIEGWEAAVARLKPLRRAARRPRGMDCPF